MALEIDTQRLVQAYESMSMREIAQELGCSEETVRRRLLAAGVAIRSRRGLHAPSTAPPTTGLNRLETLTTFNQMRSATAAQRDAEAARAALRDGDLTAIDRRLVGARVDHPAATLADLARITGMTKHAVAGRLRRLLAKYR